jgi:CO/xanthine dehydrogenase Mo-binding subunit
MDRSAVKAIIERELDPLAKKLGVGHWRLTVKFDLRDGDEDWETQGRCLVAVLDSVRMNAVEQAVVNLERMYRNLTAPPPGTPAPPA